ncbi:ArnT family glycosyltransferase [Endothiovibrio diazotrophicus]
MTQPHPPLAYRTQLILAWLAILAVYILFRLNLVDIPLERDEGAFGYMGQLLNAGGMPYRDAFDHKPPLVYHLYAFGLQFFPASARGIHLYGQLYNLATAMALFFAARLYFRATLPGLLTAFSFAIFSSSRAIQGFTTSTELFMLLPIALSLLFAVAALRASRRSRRFGALLLSGLFGAAACWTKQPAFTSVLAIFLMVTLPRLGASPADEDTPRAIRLRAALTWLAGGIAFSALVIGYYAYHGLLKELVYWAFQHNTVYAEQGRTPGQNLADVGSRVLEIMKGEGVVMLAALLGIVQALRRERKTGLFLAGFLLLSLAATVPGHNYSHYFLQLAPAVAIAAGYGFTALLRSTRAPLRPVGYAALAAAVALPLVVRSEYYFTGDPTTLSRTYFGLNPFPESELIADYLDRHSLPTDTVLVFGSEAQIPFLAQRRSATRHIIFYPLMRSFPRHMEFQHQAWEDIERNAPRYVVAVNVPTSFLWDGQAQTWIATQIDGMLKKGYGLAAWIPISVKLQTIREITAANATAELEAMKHYKYAIRIFRRNGP